MKIKFYERNKKDNGDPFLICRYASVKDYKESITSKIGQIDRPLGTDAGGILNVGK